MREDYDYLTDATRDGLTDQVKPTASGWGKCTSYIYGILDGSKKDPFAPFRSFYEGLCKGGVSTAEWDNDLAYLRQKHQNRFIERDPSQAFQDKFTSHNAIFERYLAAIADGKLTLEEVRSLEMLLDADDVIKKGVREALTAHRVKLEKGRN